MHTNTTLHERGTINGVRFNPVWGMSGVQNFFGEGWPHHKLLKRCRLLSFEGMTFVAKTTTLNRRDGNMPLRDNNMPKERMPRCIHVDLWNLRVLNAVGLSGPGLYHLLHEHQWQRREKPFMISFMSVAESDAEKKRELQLAVEMLERERKCFSSDFGIQLNESCPNVSHGEKRGPTQILARLNLLKNLHMRGVPIIVKFGLDTTAETAMEVGMHEACDGICIPNTIPFGSEGFGIPWDEWYGKESPLIRRGLKFPGGLSGEPLREHALKWITRLRKLGFTKHINGGGGLLRASQVKLFREAGADSVSIGCVAILRPYRVKGIIKEAYKVFSP